MIRVFVGTEANQLIAQKVLEYSIRKNTRGPVQVQAIHQKHERKGGTNFGFVRFTVPKLCEYKGKAIYLDADQLVFADLNELMANLDDNHDVALVNEPEGYFGGKDVAKHNQTSVMVLNCERLKDWDPDKMFAPVVGNKEELNPGQIHYRDFMTLQWWDQSRIQPLPPNWNHFNIINEHTKLTHFSHVRSQPWKTPKHALTKLWTEWLRRALQEGAVTKRDLLKEILAGNLHRSFLKCLLPPTVERLGRLALRHA